MPHPRPAVCPPARRLFLRALPVLAATLAWPAAAEIVIHLANGQTLKLPYTRAEVARIEFTGEGQAQLPGGPGMASSTPVGPPAPGAVPLGAGTPWVVNAQGAIFHRDGSGWKRTGGIAREISVGANGAVWVIGTEAVPGGRALHRLTNRGWVKVAGGGERLAVAPDGQAWVITDTGAILRQEGSRWQRMPGAARDIGIGADGSVWVIGLERSVAGFGIYRWSGSEWSRVDGDGVRIAVGPDGQPWVINATGAVFRRVGEQWQPLPGAATDIGVGSDGTAWIVGRDSAGNNAGIQRWDGQAWQRVDGMAQAIAVR